MAPAAFESDPPVALLGGSWRQFADDCGMHGTLRLVVEDTESGRVENYDFEEPFVLIGESAKCQLRLRHPEVSYRHAYLQVINSRLFCFDLESQTGTFWGPVARRQGPVTLETLLQIGPYTIRVSRAPAMTRCLDHWNDESELSNDPVGDVCLRFENATGRRSHSQLKPVRRCVTLLGRSGRCQVKLADPSVSKVHASLVRTEHAIWAVDLAGRTPIRFNDQELRCGQLGVHHRLTIGQFQMQLHSSPGRASSLMEAAVESPFGAEGTEASESGVLIRSGKAGDALTEAAARLESSRARTPTPALPPAAAPLAGALVTESTLLSVMQHFSQMQQQLMAHAEQQMLTLAQLFSAVHREQQETVLEQLNAIQAITSELRHLREASLPTAVAPDQPQSAAPAIIDASIVESSDGDNRLRTEEVRPVADDMGAAVTGRVDSDRPAEVPATVDAETAATRSGAEEDPSTASQIAEANANANSRRAGSMSGAAAHVWITQRINELERERNSRWTRLMQLVRGGQS